MRHTRPRRSRVAGALGAVLALAAPASAQLPNMSPRANGMGGNFTALATGYDAVAWNPAMLGAALNPAFSISALSAGLAGGMSPIDRATLSQYAGQHLDQATKLEWLQRVTDAGGERGTASGSATLVGLSRGPLAFQVATNMYVRGTMSPDMVELMLFGNNGKSGTPGTMDFAGTDFVGASYTTAALAYGRPVRGIPGLSVGVTGKYILGTGMIAGRDAGSVVTPDSIEVQVPYVQTATFGNPGRHAGSGLGLDAGLAWQSGRLVVGAAVRNVVNTFRWNTAAFSAKAGYVLVTRDSSNTAGFGDDIPFDLAPQALRDAVEDDRWKPDFSIGAAYSVTNTLLVSADARRTAIRRGLGSGEESQIGVGAEWRALRYVPIRAGVARYDTGWGATGGFGLALGRFEAAISGSVRGGEPGAIGAMIAAVSIR